MLFCFFLKCRRGKLTFANAACSVLRGKRHKALLQIKRPMNGTQMFQAILFLVIMNCTCLALPTNTEVPKNFSERDFLTPLYR